MRINMKRTTTRLVLAAFLAASAVPGIAAAQLGFQTTDRLGADGLASVGTYGWGGAYGSTYKVDPAERLVIVFMINQLPNRTDVAAKFPTLVYQALVEPRVVVGARAP